MPNTYSCTYPDCGEVFSKAFELKKHKFAHEHPERVYSCPECKFITLQKKNLPIHRATHTGEKTHRCPHMVSTIESSKLETHQERCDYRTNDPAALTKHRKKAHGYIPQLIRKRSTKASPAPRRPRQTTDGTPPCHHNPSPSQCPLPVSCPPLSHIPVPQEVDTSGSGDSHSFASATLGHSMDLNVPTWDFSNVAFVAPREEMDLNTLYDPSLDPEWMAKYEMSYSMFDTTGMKYVPEPLPAVSSSYLASLNVQTGREGCLCPEWMVDAGIEGWDQSVLDVHGQYWMLTGSSTSL